MLAEFGAKSTEPLPGGRGRSRRAGDLVLKPLDWPAHEFLYHAELLATIREDGFRLSRPLPRVVDGWIAAPYLEGAHEQGRWGEIIAVGRRLHDALAGVPRPALIDARDDPWTTGDRVAWGERDHPAAADVVDALEPVSEPSQLVHCDLTGNVLFHPTLPPAIIDFAPYWRPREYAEAVVVADALCWEDAPADLAEAVDRQYLLRALVFRGVTSIEFGGDGERELGLARRIAACASP